MSGWERIDDLILGGVAIAAIKEIRVAADCSLQDAIERYHERAVWLHETRSTDFNPPQDEVSDDVGP
ncbi:hypothetical protein F4553_000024 [Allocatelliglobosispora scoriae]|uniref:Uncharacterized protein n=1 Tax=Allocatelliglobosispora scoriae TaxID=643052 RepID=A0A841BG89_9ACTN|nr:hypothetical protein [Allocatelliglobosispora scoriae]MBB5866645.1 hypothetical protein [Allocatelliglobosispora scoriae]